MKVVSKRNQREEKKKKLDKLENRGRQNSDQATDEENELVRVQSRRFDMSKAYQRGNQWRVQGRSVFMGRTKCEETSDDSAGAIHSVPQSDSHGLLTAAIPRCRNEGEERQTSRFKQSQEEACCSEPRKVVRTGHAT